MLRSNFNAMFVNLSRRSQALIERLVRTIDSLEQNEEDPDRLSYLFSMDHLVTRMRRNSENLLLLAGHDSARKWSEPVSLADVARAATSEIEQYSRVGLSIQPGISVSGQAVSDVVRLLAEIIENATIFSPKDTQVRVSAQELTSGGVLIEVSDSGVGISAARLEEMNLRLINPPVIDVSVSRHMGLFAVARLAERHGVRVRLRAGSPQGLTALVWLPDSVTERGTRPYGGYPQPRTAPQADFQTARRTAGRHSLAVRSAPDGQPAHDDRLDVVGAARQIGTGPRQTVQANSTTSSWFDSRRPSATDTASSGNMPPSPDGWAEGKNGWAEGKDGWAEGKHAAQIIADPIHGSDTAAGLPVRVPRANLLPGSAGGGRPADSRATSRTADGYQAQTSAALRPPRSPELARSRLSGFQRGARRAESQTPRTAEGADR
jgi:hypothetical protein